MLGHVGLAIARKERRGGFSCGALRTGSLIRIEDRAVHFSLQLEKRR